MDYSLIKSIFDNDFLLNAINDDLITENKKQNYYHFKFCDSDDEKNFMKNLHLQPKDWYYAHNDVTYTVNSLGYRTKNFNEIDWENSIVMFGCSHIFGVGVDDEHTVPYFLEKLIGIPVINMGCGGTGIQYTLHNSLILKDSNFPAPRGVICCWHDLLRYHTYSEKFIKKYGAWNFCETSVDFKNASNLIAFNLMNIKMIRNLWNSQTNYFEFCLKQDTFKLIKQISNFNCKHYNRGLFKINYKNLARDLLHYGKDVNYWTAEQIAKDFTNSRR
jgi:hypothetical protein